ncbi:uncharacterized protein DSM5745_04130 [Aspergillus mulundensis]|uniref:Rhodopsin domain-containing protein n=1 Tax=Aspergillus mulundensis TaxID=1810919 RepID=A0A3D8SCJ2_9EURO|nr:Uncharacterized protein DSM5745_04130 [Aspergillus mulundensis]RDW83804.1 Uncharacterized protein DSM5745_04130 [Aspergillus mulundensis]
MLAGSDDYIMTVTFLIYTTLLILIRVSAKYATNLFPASELESILSDPHDVANRVYGSKIVIGLEQCMLLSTWGVKTCLVTMYWKLTHRLPWHLFVQILAGYVALGFVVIEITYFAVYCRPFSQYWAVPVSNPQCATYQHYSITQAVFNLSSDAFMLIIPIPLLKGTQMPMKKKVLLISVLGLGVFVMVAAILNKYFNFASPDTTIYQLWYIREASTAIYVANLMCWWPLLRKVFGSALSQYSSNYRANGYEGPSQRSALQSHSHSQHHGSVNASRASAIFTGKVRVKATESRRGRWWRSEPTATTKGLKTSASQEAINTADRVDSPADRHEGDVPLEIWRKVEYNVEQTAPGPGPGPGSAGP